VTATWLPRMPRVVSSIALPAQPAPDRIKVLHIITNFTTGAGGNTLLSAIGMDTERYEVFIASSPGGEFWDRAEAAGVKTRRLPGFVRDIAPLKDLSVLLQLIRLIRRERFSIIHTHTTKAGFLGRVAARLCGTPVVVHTFHAFSFHDFMDARVRRAYMLLERLMRPLTDEFLAVAPQVAREAVEYRLVRPGRVSVAPSAVELSDLPPAPDETVRHEFAIAPSAPLIGTVGRICYQKAPLDFVRMAARVAEHRPDARFIMVGDGEMTDEVRAEAERAGVDIILTGFRDDAPRITGAFDVFVMPSLYEGLGRALTEALACGCPVVASAVNGVPDLVRPGETGLLAAPGDPEAAAKSVLWLLDHPVEAKRMGRQGRAAVLDLFKPEHMCAVLDDTYSRLLGVPSPAPDDLGADERSRTSRTVDLASVAAEPQSSRPDRVLRARPVGRHRSRHEGGAG
jgi:glycosyltransferase involved in cell wall biosynthesis